ncbi:hypothetical protein RHGRI_003145 [Rhododendron griersonianum]|uniref:Uncharacterized protein n=1 Tax=Rhododendron griersonianum TaxID=479676 RepID=A0AAV6LTV5_9ERIC|nr:hypothetical protein RHGRI_003145 [Rhododendron griersonianum]
MASSTRGGRGDIKGFFRQRKKSGGIAKPKGKKSSPIHSAAFGSDVAQPPAVLISHASLDLTEAIAYYFAYELWIEAYCLGCESSDKAATITVMFSNPDPPGRSGKPINRLELNLG